MNAPEAKAATEPQAAEITAHFNAAMLRWVSPMRAIDDPRYYLYGVLVEPHPSGRGVYLVATNGNALTVACDENGFASERFVIQISDEAIKSISRHHEYANYHKANQVVISGDRLKTVNTPLEGDAREIYIQPESCQMGDTFPDWRALIKSKAEITPGGDNWMDIRLINLIQAALPKDPDFLAVRSFKQKKDTDHSAAMFFQFDKLPLLAVVMPCRIKDAKPFGWFL